MAVLFKQIVVEHSVIPAEVETVFVRKSFCRYDIHAPGHQPGALPMGKEKYPTQKMLGEMIHAVVTHFKMKDVWCLGVGAGANAFLYYAYQDDDNIRGMILISPAVTKVGWREWAWDGWQSTKM
eukprot:gene7568-379_t